MTAKNKLFVLVIAVVLLVSACGAQGNSNRVEITLTDFGIESSQTSFEVGVPYHFVVTNNGVIEHEIMLMAPLTEDQMMMNMDMEEMDEMALTHVEASDLQPNKTAEFDYTFTDVAPAGTLEFSCHIPSHYEAGMKLPFIVK